MTLLITMDFKAALTAKRAFRGKSALLMEMAAALLAVSILATSARAQVVRVDNTPAHVVNTFQPRYALGSTVDRVPSNATDTFFRPDQIQKILSAGWGVISYRQNTDLFVQAWHWNPKGRWSDPSGKGYFVGDATPTAKMIRHSYGYQLPHRGFTRNNGTEFDGYSRLDDGDLQSYWKSNPYLSKAFTGEDDSLHPQWVVINLGHEQEVNTVRIAWAEPFARAYQVQYWTGSGDAMDEQDKGAWHPFASGKIRNGQGGTPTIRLDSNGVRTQFVRVLMTASSNTCDSHGSSDRRNCVGFAVREVYLGFDSDGKFTDVMHHSPSPNQTLTYGSSVDSWHDPKGIATDDGEQPGFDLVYKSGLTQGLQMTVPVAMMYDNPDNAANEIAYIESRGYAINYVEMGEEPDGQFGTPEDDAALYVQWADAIHKVDQKIKLAGPVFEGVNSDIQVWRDARGNVSWFNRFLNYLRSHNHLR